MSLWSLAFPEGRIILPKPRLEGRNSSKLVTMSSSRCFFCMSWWGVDTEDNKDETPGSYASAIHVHYNASTNFLPRQCSSIIAYVDTNVAGMLLGEVITQQFLWHWPGDDELIRLIDTSIFNPTILHILNVALLRGSPWAAVMIHVWTKQVHVTNHWDGHMQNTYLQLREHGCQSSRSWWIHTWDVCRSISDNYGGTSGFK